MCSATRLCCRTGLKRSVIRRARSQATIFGRQGMFIGERRRIRTAYRAKGRSAASAKPSLAPLQRIDREDGACSRHENGIGERVCAPVQHHAISCTSCGGSRCALVQPAAVSWAAQVVAGVPFLSPLLAFPQCKSGPRRPLIGIAVASLR
jgi:hypothetical protein